jgi:alcohol dehydrogenase (cytochrome c)
MLFTIDGRRTVIQPNKTCFIHYLDARDGTFLQAPRFCDKITWADGYDRKGEPIWSQPVPKEGETIELWPSMLGGVNLYPSAINPRTGMLYLAAQEVGIAWSYEKIQVTSNVQSLGVSYEILSGGREVDKAVDLRTGAEIWRHDANKAGYAGGMLTTAGGLAIWATQGGELTVADATNGKVLWQLNANTTAKSGPITYMVDGQQQITFALGGSGGFGSVADDWKNTNHGSMVITLGR